LHTLHWKGSFNSREVISLLFVCYWRTSVYYSFLHEKISNHFIVNSMVQLKVQNLVTLSLLFCMKIASLFHKKIHSASVALTWLIFSLIKSLMSLKDFTEAFITILEWIGLFPPCFFKVLSKLQYTENDSILSWIKSPSQIKL